MELTDDVRMGVNEPASGDSIKEALGGMPNVEEVFVGGRGIGNVVRVAGTVGVQVLEELEGGMEIGVSVGVPEGGESRVDAE